MCDQCEALMINGVYCHEAGCPNIRALCDECGQETDETYNPNNHSTRFCSDDCYMAYCGIDPFDILGPDDD